MKQMGLNVAMDSFMNSAYIGTDSAMVLISVDDPGPHSSQTEQDRCFFAMAGKIPVLDSSTIQEAYEFAKKAVEISERFGIPIMLRSSTRISHGRSNVEVDENFRDNLFNVRFKNLKDLDKKLSRYAATPRQRLSLHKVLNDKIEEIAKENKIRYFFSGDILILSSGAVFPIFMS